MLAANKVFITSWCNLAFTNPGAKKGCLINVPSHWLWGISYARSCLMLSLKVWAMLFHFEDLKMWRQKNKQQLMLCLTLSFCAEFR